MPGRSWIKRIGDVRRAEEDDEDVLDHERHPESCDENDGRSCPEPDERADHGRMHEQCRESSGERGRERGGDGAARPLVDEIGRVRPHREDLAVRDVRDIGHRVLERERHGGQRQDRRCDQREPEGQQRLVHALTSDEPPIWLMASQLLGRRPSAPGSAPAGRCLGPAGRTRRGRRRCGTGCSRAGRWLRRN